AIPLEPRLDSLVAVGEVFDAVGYGITNPADTRGQTAGMRMRLNGLLVECVGTKECFGSGATDTEWGAAAPVCRGDSGGPALDDSGRVIGLVSRGSKDCTFALYSAVSAWRSFILDGANNAASAGGYVPPSWVTAVDAGATEADAGLAVMDA